MTQIPAVCTICGLKFPSPFRLTPNSEFRGNKTKCPRCGAIAQVYDGITAIIDGLVKFIVSPDFTIEEKQFLFYTTKAVAAGAIKSKDAERQLAASNNDSLKLFREWSVWGMTLLAMIATVGSFLLAYAESRGNSPLEDLAREKFNEELIKDQQSTATTSFAPSQSFRPQTKNLLGHQTLKNRQGSTTNPDAPNENRKTRRARIKQERTKSRN